MKSKVDKITRAITRVHEKDSGTAESKRLADIEAMNVLKLKAAAVLE